MAPPPSIGGRSGCSADQPLELLGVVAALEGHLLVDPTGLHVRGDRHVHRLHPVAAAGLHGGVDLVDLPLADQVADGRGRDQHLHRGHAALAVGRLEQLLRDDTLKGGGQLHPHLLLLVRREHVDDAVDRLRGVLRVQRREDQVAGLGRGDRGGDRLEVSHLADQDDVGVLAQDVLQRLAEPVGVGADLALVHDALLVLVQELDRVLDGHDVAGPFLVDDVDHAGERGRLARARRAGHHDEPAREPGEIRDDPGQTQLFQPLDLERDEPERRAERIPLLVDVHTEPRLTGQRVGHVQLELLLEPLAQLLRQDRVDHALQRPGRQRRVLLQPLQLAVHAHDGRGPHREVEVRAAHLQERGEQLRNRDLYVVLICLHRHLTSPPLRSLRWMSGPCGPSPDRRREASSFPARYPSSGCHRQMRGQP